MESKMNQHKLPSDHPANHSSNFEPTKLKEVIKEMSLTLRYQSVRSDGISEKINKSMLKHSVAPMKQFSDDVSQLQDTIYKIAWAITILSNEMYLKCIVGSIFDTQTAEDTLVDLKAYNEGWKPKWLFKIKDPIL